MMVGDRGPRRKRKANVYIKRASENSRKRYRMDGRRRKKKGRTKTHEYSEGEE